MAQDFAKSRKSTNKPAKKKPARSATRNTPSESRHWSWFLSGLFSGVLLCVIGYFSLGQLRNNNIIANNPLAGLGNEGGEQSGTELEFYDYLPQAEVEVDVVPVAITENTPEEEANPITYLLQAASFQNPSEAEALRARLILMNLDARIVPSNVSGRTWYRVQAGPFVGKRAMEAAETTLIQNNIDPIRMRISTQ